MPIDPIQVTTGGSAALLALYVLITALVVYNSKKCAYCDVRLVVCNYLIALCSCELLSSPVSSLLVHQARPLS